MFSRLDMNIGIFFVGEINKYPRYQCFFYFVHVIFPCITVHVFALSCFVSYNSFQQIGFDRLLYKRIWYFSNCIIEIKSYFVAKELYVIQMLQPLNIVYRRHRVRKCQYLKWDETKETKFVNRKLSRYIVVEYRVRPRCFYELIQYYKGVRFVVGVSLHTNNTGSTAIV